MNFVAILNSFSDLLFRVPCSGCLKWAYRRETPKASITPRFPENDIIESFPEIPEIGK